MRLVNLTALFACALTAQANQPPSVYLEHALVTVDTETFQAISDSAFLRDQFSYTARNEVQAANGQSWSGFYLHGEESYIEILAQGAAAGLPLGWGGMGFVVDQDDELDQVHAAMQAVAPDHAYRNVRSLGAKGGITIPTFHATGLQFPELRAQIGAGAWVMEYHDQYAAQFGGKKDRHTLQESRFSAEKLFEDITGVQLNLTEPSLRAYQLFFRALGYQYLAGAHPATFRGPEHVVLAFPATGQRVGVRAVEFRLTRPPIKPSRIALGATVLEVGPGPRGIWYFSTLQAAY